MDAVEAFANEARVFEKWLLDGTDQDADAARTALIHLSRLYAAGLQLPPAWSPELDVASDVERLSETEWRRAYSATRRLPLDLYSEVFRPTTVPAEDEPVVGSVAEDLADIYRDVATGLRAFERGQRPAAVWEWSFNLQCHWGAHATSAIRALHWWLIESAVDKPGSESTKTG